MARYLRPEAEVVGFWPRPELEELARWLASAERVAVRLVTGGGGSGKTRLARELGAQATGLGWRWYWVPAGQEAAAVAVARGGSEPVLLVADYAETRTGLAAMLAAAAGAGPCLRILLLARSAGEWWRQLQDSIPDETSDLLAAAEPLTLGPVAAGAGQQAVFAAALAAFAALRGVACPDVQLRLADPDAVVLVVHAAALLAVLDADTSGSGAGLLSGGEVLSGLLGHERRYWQRSLATWATVSLDPDVIDRAVAAGCLVGAGDQEEAMRLLEVIPDLADGLVRGKVARWLHDLYPVPDGVAGQEWIGQLQPDLLAERLVVGVLDQHPELAGRLLTGLGQARAARALTILGRAALTQPAALAQIRQSLHTDPEHLLVPAVTVTTETNPALASLIMNVQAATTLPARTLTAVAAAIPYPTVALAELNVAVTRQLVGALPSDTFPAGRAGLLNRLGIALSQLGRPAEALPVAQEAVIFYRELATADPDLYRPELATCLNNLGVRLWELGRPAEALPVAREAVTLYRELATADPDRYRPDLARSLSNLGVWFSELGRPAEALPVTQEAVEIRRGLAAASPDRYRPDLATSLNNFAIRLWEVGRRAEALPVAREAVTLYRELAAASPDRFRPDLAASLSNLGVLFSELGRRAEALPVTQEAMEIRRELTAANPDRFRPDLAASLSNLGVRLWELGRPVEALPVTQEAVEIRREQAAASPERYRPDLARSLSNLGVLFSELGRRAEALSVTQEAVEIRRELAAERPDRYRPDLATSLNNLGIWFSVLGRTAEALPVTQEAVVLYRELAAASPDRYLPDLARSLNNLGTRFSELGRTADSLPVTQEAVTLYRELAAASPDRYRPTLATSLNNLAAVLTSLGRTAEAERILKDAES